jgi:zinc protease
MLGGSVAGSVAAETFGWSISVPTRFVAAAVDLLADVVQHPTLDETSLETERAVAISDVIAMRDDMYRYPVRLAMEAAYAGHPYGTPATGSEESLRRIDRDAVRRWHAERVMTGPGVVVLVGDGDPDELATLAAGAFAELEPRTAPTIAPPVWPNEIVTRVEARARAQTALTLMFPSPPRQDEARFSAAMIASVASGLGGRFFDELRDKRSLCYTVHAFTVDRVLAGSFGAYIATSPEQEDAARDGLLAEFSRLREELVTPEELERAQTYAIGVHAIRQQSGSAVLADVFESWLLGELRNLAEFDARIRRVTRESAREVARRYFDPSRRVEGIVRGG